MAYGRKSATPARESKIKNPFLKEDEDFSFAGVNRRMKGFENPFLEQKETQRIWPEFIEKEQEEASNNDLNFRIGEGGNMTKEVWQEMLIAFDEMTRPTIKQNYIDIVESLDISVSDRSTLTTKLETFIEDPHGGFHETGGLIILTKDNQIQISKLLPGSANLPNVSNLGSKKGVIPISDRVTIDLNCVISQNYYSQDFQRILGNFHVHPSGRYSVLFTNETYSIKYFNLTRNNIYSQVGLNILNERVTATGTFVKEPSQIDLISSKANSLQTFIVIAFDKFDNSDKPVLRLYECIGGIITKEVLSTFYEKAF
jgi:hypothetical protein